MIIIITPSLSLDDDDDNYHNYDYHFKDDNYYVVYHTSLK